jgi:hypothetical protein
MLRRVPPSRALRTDPAYRDSLMPSVLQANLPPVWDDAERPTRPHRRRDCDAESAAGRTKQSASGRSEHCSCGNRRPLTAEGIPDGDWLFRNSELAATAVPTTPVAVAASGIRRWVDRLLRRGRTGSDQRLTATAVPPAAGATADNGPARSTPAPAVDGAASGAQPVDFRAAPPCRPNEKGSTRDDCC